MTWKEYALASAFFAGLTALFGKLGVSTVNSNLATFVRVLVILAFTAAWISARSEWQWHQLDRRGMLFLVLSGLATGLSWLCYYRALQLGPASHVAPVDKLSVVFSVLLALIVLREPLNWRLAAGVVTMLAGSLLVLQGAS
jgi:transporter family protein